MSPEKRAAFLASLTPAEKAVLYYRWSWWRRDSQKTPDGPWSVWLILSGRGFGKSRVGAEWVRARAESGRFRRFALIGETAADARDVMVEGESGILACSPPWFYPQYEPSKRRLTWPNGAIASTFSGDDPDQLRGPQFDSAWADEPAKWRYADAAWANLEMALRLGDNPQVVATTTPRPIKLIKELVADPQTVVTRGHTDENRANLSPQFLARVVRRYEGTRLGRQELSGEILDDNPDALFKRAQIDATRLSGPLPNLTLVAIGVDPQAASPGQRDDAGEGTGAETGIVAAGWDGNRNDPHFYVLGDHSLKDSPEKWGGEVVAAYSLHKADRIIGEQNNGGAMVEYVVTSSARARGVSIRYEAVHASRGKQTRAEPIAGLYEQGRVHHVGSLPVLEDQMVEWAPGDKVSPDRMDALVWVLTRLAESSGWLSGVSFSADFPY